jgi:hypothetical protein
MSSIGLWPKRNPMKTAVEMSVIILGLTLAMPVCCGVFPQMSSVAVCDLEEEIQSSIKDRKLTHLVYNKGL